MVFEEDVDLKHESAGALRHQEGNPDGRDYGLIAELYNQLKKNYDDRKDYWTEGDFHYGEMEMKRLSSPRKNPDLRWLHRNLGLVAWYRHASQYGESYLRPAVWLLGVLLLFALFYPALGLRYDASRDAQHATASAPNVVVLTYWQPFRPGAASATGKWSAWMWWLCGRVPWLCLFGHSSLTALYISALQKELVYEPIYPWGRLFALLQILLTSTLFALFVLALRRQFRR